MVVYLTMCKLEVIFHPVKTTGKKAEQMLHIANIRPYSRPLYRGLLSRDNSGGFSAVIKLIIQLIKNSFII